MRLLNIKNKYKFFLKLFLSIGKIILISNNYVFACESLNFEKSIVWLDSRSKIIVELAETNIKRTQGLKCRKKMLNEAGMLFIWEKEDYRAFWMKDTFIPLDIIFFDKDKKIFDFFLNAKPFDQTPILSNGKAKYVLELNAGEFKRLDLKLGQQLIFEDKIKFFQ